MDTAQLRAEIETATGLQVSLLELTGMPAEALVLLPLLEQSAVTESGIRIATERRWQLELWQKTYSESARDTLTATLRELGLGTRITGAESRRDSRYIATIYQLTKKE
ncbi:MAG: hypothetical protein PHO41_09905 [Eubacteriales bacterium]|nr:hypothetical protein [Eubacteriales bacterium]